MHGNGTLRFVDGTEFKGKLSNNEFLDGCKKEIDGKVTFWDKYK
jgi:hypothetical protein